MDKLETATMNAAAENLRRRQQEYKATQREGHARKRRAHANGRIARCVICETERAVYPSKLRRLRELRCPEQYAQGKLCGGRLRYLTWSGWLAPSEQMGPAL